MAISIRPMTARLAGRLRGRRPLEAVARESRELAAAISLDTAPTIQLADDLDRIIRLADGIDMKDFRQRMTERLTSHSATVAYRVRDAVIIGQTVYSGSDYFAVGPDGRRRTFVAAAQEFAERLLATNEPVERYFGHWLTDGLSLELLTQQVGVPAIGFDRPPWTQESDYRMLTGLTLDRSAHAHVSDLWMVDDRGMNASRVARMAELRRRVRSSAPSRQSMAPVFLRRQGGAARELVNQDHLADSLARRGFVVVTPELETVAGLRDKIAGARLVVSVEGSALCHGVVAMMDGGTICAIQPPRRVNWIQKAWCDCAGLRFAQTIADPTVGDAFTLSEERLYRLIDQIDRENPI